MKLLTALFIAALLLPTSASANVLFYQIFRSIAFELPLELDTPTQPFPSTWGPEFVVLEFVNFDGVYAHMEFTKDFYWDVPGTAGVGVFYGDEPIYDGDQLQNRLSWQPIDGGSAGLEFQLYAVPEPGTWLLMLGALLVLWRKLAS